MTSIAFTELLALGREQAGVEFKGPGDRSDRRLFAKVARAVLAMANRRDGGVVVVGIDDERNEAVLTGLSATQLATWEQDAVRDALAAYADPGVEVEVEPVRHGGRDFVVITIREFADVPVLCRRDGDGVREGALYVRSRRKPESVEVPRQAEMRDVIELATEKRLRAFLATATAVGIGAATRPAAPDAGTAYAGQRAALDSEIVRKARSRGHWDLVVAPADFVPRRLDNVAALFGLVSKSDVLYRGWPYPAVLDNDPKLIGADFAGQDVDSRMHVEGWRLFQSGQFAHVLGFWEDWYEQDFMRGPREKLPEAGAELSIPAAVYTLTEFAEFAARLALAGAGADGMRLEVGVRGLAGRALKFGPGFTDFAAPPTATLDAFDLDPVVLTRTELVADPRGVAATAAREVFRRFGYDAPLERLRAIQQTLERR